MTAKDTIFIMQGIDLPAETGNGGGGPKTQYPFETMQVGDAFFLPGRNASKFSPYAGKFARRFKRKFQCRDVFMTKQMKDGNQVGWKLCASSSDDGAISGCVVKRLTDPTPEELAAREREDKAKADEKAKGEAKPGDEVPPDPAPVAAADGEKVAEAAKAPATPPAAHGKGHPAGKGGK